MNDEKGAVALRHPSKKKKQPGDQKKVARLLLS